MEGDELQRIKERKAAEARVLLAKILDEVKLTDYQQEVFDLTWGEALSDLEIARKLKKSNGAIRRMKTYIRKKLRNSPTAKEMDGEIAKIYVEAAGRGTDYYT